MQQAMHNLYLEVTRVYVALMRLAAFNALCAFLCPLHLARFTVHGLNAARRI